MPRGKVARRGVGTALRLATARAVRIDCDDSRRGGSPDARGREAATPAGDMEGRAMCGIVGYIGSQEAEPVLVEGLRRLEYRGYDSAGLVTLALEDDAPRVGARLHLRKRAGRIQELARLLRDKPSPGCVGISHT